MAGREFQGAGGLRLHLDEPYSPQMADQIAKGHLVPVADEAAVEEEPVVETPLGDGEAKRPTANSKVDEWRTYAVSRGMDEVEAAAATKTELQDWVKVADGDGGSGD